jgi:hypothetical protein
MKKFLLLCFLPCVVMADDFKTLDGDLYTNAVVKSVEPDGIRITYPDGVTKLKFKDLAPDMQKKYGYDPAKAATFQAQQEEQQQSAAIAQQNAQLDKKNIELLTAAQIGAEGTYDYYGNKKESTGAWIRLYKVSWVEDYVLPGASDGTYPPSMHNGKVSHTTRIGNIFVLGATEAADRVPFEGDLYPTGDTKIDFTETPCLVFATTPELALKAIKEKKLPIGKVIDSARGNLVRSNQ